MNIKQAISLFQSYQQSNHRKRTVESYRFLLEQFGAFYAERPVDTLRPEEIYDFLERVTKDLAKSTRRLRYAQLKAFFNFVIERTHILTNNPCNDPLLSKAFRAPRMTQREIIGREVIDEIIYRCSKARNRLILELQARCGLRIGEVLNLRASDVSGRRLTLRRPKSGREEESAFMPETVATRLKGYIEAEGILSDNRLFPICYSTARSFVKRLGENIDVKIRPHDLRRHSATYASRNGVPLEIISKVILRHQDLKTTQMYLGRISETEALRWMDVLHGK